MATKPSSAASFVAWNWAIESLASYKQIDASVVVDLVKRTPGGPNNLGRSAKEIFSFRVLENLFVPGTGTGTGTETGIGITKTCSPSPNSKIHFVPSDCCADVLEHILLEIPGPILKDELETLKDFQAFILDKRSHLPKCPLEQIPGPNLKDELETLKDFQAFILDKRSHLPKCPLEQLKDAILQGSHPRLASLKERAGLPHEKWSENGIHVDDDDCRGVPDRIDGSTDGQTVATRNSCSMNLEYGGDPVQDFFPEANIVFNKTVRISLDENIEKTMYKDFGTEVPSGKSREEESRSFYVNEEGCDENDGSDKVSSTLIGEEKNDMESELSAGTVGYLKEMADIDSKKHALLSYKCMLREENDVQTHQKDISNCVHCNKGGQLLICSSDACPLVIHETCLKSAGTFDSGGKFYCHFCVYSRLVSDFQDAKESYSLAKKKLAASICGGMKCWPTNFFKKSAQRLDKLTHKRKRNDVNRVGGTRYKSNREVEQTGTSVFYAAAGELSERKGKAVTNGKGSLSEKD